MIIRSAKPADAGRLLEIYAYYVNNTAITFECTVPEAEEFQSRIESTLKKYPYLVLEENNVIRGYAYAAALKERAAYDHSCEVTVYLAHDAKGLGYGRKLYEALEAELKARGILNLYACIADPEAEDEFLTKNSVQFHEHLGFRKAGEFHKCGFKFDRWYNVSWMEKIIGHHDAVRPAGAAEELELYVPRPEDGWFYKKMMSDPATMSYNAPWFPPDGCIPDPESEWADLQEEWIGREPERFYAFLRRVSDGAFVGDVNYHYNPVQGWHDMGIVIFAAERGKGYGKQGLRLLADRAFRVDGISRLHNDFETSRGAAYRIHKAAGFRETGTEDGQIRLELTREEYGQ